MAAPPIHPHPRAKARAMNAARDPLLAGAGLRLAAALAAVVLLWGAYAVVAG